MAGESHQNVFLIQIDASSFEISEFEISRFDWNLLKRKPTRESDAVTLTNAGVNKES